MKSKNVIVVNTQTKIYSCHKPLEAYTYDNHKVFVNCTNLIKKKFNNDLVEAIEFYGIYMPSKNKEFLKEKNIEYVPACKVYSLEEYAEILGYEKKENEYGYYKRAGYYSYYLSSELLKTKSGYVHSDILEEINIENIKADGYIIDNVWFDKFNDWDKINKDSIIASFQCVA